ncbi:MAG: hypothetical protein C0497_04945 [Gemmatimonas sp.]|nr:hypothetical protein [Gemmatimonas sp.]
MCQCHQLPDVRDRKRTPQHAPLSTLLPRVKRGTAERKHEKAGMSTWRRWKHRVLGALSSILIGCSGSSSTTTDHAPKMASMAMMPDAVHSAAAVTQEAYQFAVANPQILQSIPCYCGCGGMGHTSNYSCYVQRVGNAGALVFDTHALGCSICVDITQDAMRLSKQGKSLPEIKAYVHDTYARFGPSNM